MYKCPRRVNIKAIKKLKEVLEPKISASENDDP
jgi:hypothetical protein